ncbi:MAG TPA: hypothetical protein VM432_07195 [Bdellovibrionales bacterium]|nr:hypothetical protein [Bdellovibrionales bacterium]
MKQFVSLIAAGFLLVACAKPQGNDRLAEKAKIDAEKQAEADRKTQDNRASAMEADLARTQNFFQGVRGLFEGSLKTPSGRKYIVRLNIHPNIERYEGDRVRTADEVAFDLKNLAFDVAENTIAKMSDGSDLSFGCTYSSIRPGVDRGSFVLEDDCPRSFAVNVVADGSRLIHDRAELEEMSRTLARSLLDREIEQVMQLQVEMRSPNIPEIMTFSVRRVR